MSAIGRFTRRDPLRWSAAATVAVGLHAAAFALGYNWLSGRQPAGATQTAVMVDLAPVITAPAQQPVEAPEPGPVLEQAEPQIASNTPPAEPPAETIVPPAPVPSDIPIVEQKKKADEPTKREPKHEEPVKQKQAIARPRESTEKPPASRTSAPPKPERIATAAAPTSLGENTSSVSLTSYAAQVAAHIARFKQYPAAARNQASRGIARVSYTVSRGGQVLSAHLAGSSGTALLDQEALAAVRRAQPLPPIPANLAQPQTLTTPIQFSIN